MALLSSTPIRHYVFGLVCTFVGAWLTEAMDSLVPLSVGGAMLVMTTGPLVRHIRARRATGRDSR